MNNFGVFEVATTRNTKSPGWAYVPDVSTQSAALVATNRKRGARAAAAGPAVSLSDLSARQDAKRRRELEALDRDAGGGKDVVIPSKSRAGTAKHTPAVRKILQSQKTFNNHLDDFVAAQALENQAAAAASRRSIANKGAGDGDVDMSDAPVGIKAEATTGDAQNDGEEVDPLLVSWIPPVPTKHELNDLVTAAPLSYNDARGGYDGRYPVRVFCEVCGYWGRVKCMKCGTRVCALDCLELHREECVTRYGV